MKKKSFLFLFITSIILFACEGPIYHNFEVVNKTDNLLLVQISINNSDSIILRYILQDSSMIIYSTNEIQGFFSDKIQARSISNVLKKIDIVKDSISSNSNYFVDSIWTVDYKPGTYTYKLIVETKDFE